MADIKRYKFQALVTPRPDGDGGTALLSSGSHRMVLRAENPETHRTQVFSALVDTEDSDPYQSKREIVVTLRVIGDDVAEYLDIGSHFSLWQGSDVGEGVVTRRLHI